MNKLSFWLTFLLFCGISRAALVEKWYNLTYVDVNPDGLAIKRAIGVNGTYPPPPLDVNINDTVLIHTLNSLDRVATIHHHGIYFNGTSYYDGANAVTQCGIPVGESFTYEVPVSSQWGTYWWHSHANGQYVEGLRAPLVIHPTVEAHAYDEEFTILLADWYHTNYQELLHSFLNRFNPTGAEPVPDSALMYFAQNGTYLTGYNNNATLTFTAGKTYRLRVINMSALAMFHFWIDGHDMRIIEADGTDVQEFPVDHLSLAVAQRYSVLVTALNNTSSNYYIHANQDPEMYDTVPKDLTLNLTSNLVYDTSNGYAEASTIDDYSSFDDTQLVPVTAQSELPVDVSHDLQVYFEARSNGVNRAMFNNITYQMPVVPTILTANTMGELSTTTPKIYGQINPFVLESGQNIEFRVYNGDAGNHPFHLHGHKFQLVYKSDDMSAELNISETQTNPLRRDTVQVPAGGVAVLRFTADNPGVWLFHCHIDWHLESGLALALITAPNEIQQETIPDALLNQCKMQSIPTSGNAAGYNSTTNFSGLTFGPGPEKIGWFPKGIGALAGCIIAAVLGMASVVWYAFGALEESVAENIVREQHLNKKRGIISRRLGFKN